MQQRNNINRELATKNKNVTKKTMLNNSFDLAGRLQMLIELRLAKHFKFAGLISVKEYLASHQSIFETLKNLTRESLQFY